MSNCQLCNSTDHKVLFNEEFRANLCRNCSLVFLEQDPQRDLENFYREEIHYGTHEKYDLSVFKWITGNIPKGDKTSLIEIGCGQGTLLKKMKEAGFTVFGVEPGNKAVEAARDNIGIENIKHGLLSEFEGIDHLFDYVVLAQTFEHFPDPLESLLEIKRLIKKDGLLFIEVPSFFSPTGLFRWKVNGENYPSVNHLFVYSKHTLEAFLNKAGFHILKTEPTFGNLRIIATLNDKPSKNKTHQSHTLTLLFLSILPFLKNIVDGLISLKRKVTSNRDV